MLHSTFPRSGVLVLGPNYIQSLVPSTLISQIEALLDAHKLEDALSLAEQQRKKLQANPVVNEDETDELRYVYQRLGFEYLTETLFEDAGKCFFNGDLDPRLLVSYFPDLRGNLFTSTETLDVFSGVAEHMPQEDSVDDIIRNYSPHLSPNTQSAPPTAELRKILGVTAREMLEVFLRRWRNRIGVQNDLGLGGKGKAKDVRLEERDANGVPSIHVVVDTVLAKLYALSEKTSPLYDLLASPQSRIVVSELEETLRQTGQYCALCLLYRKHGDTTGVVSRGKLLGVLSKLVDGEWTDEDVKDPLSDMVSVLSEKTKDKEGDRALLRRWGIWILKRDLDRGLRLLMADKEREGRRRANTNKAAREEEEIALLDEISEADEEAGQQWLEYLIVKKRSTNAGLHSRFAKSCVERLGNTIQTDEAVEKLWRAKASSYASTYSYAAQSQPHSSSTSSIPTSTSTQPQSQPQAQSYLTYFASTTPDSPSKRLRLKTILFLAGSNLYNPEEVKGHLLSAERGVGSSVTASASTGSEETTTLPQSQSQSSKGKGKQKSRMLLGLELAILEGKLKDHHATLQTLVHEVNDSYSAEAYCALGGEAVVPRKVAVAVAEGCAGLEDWGDVLFLFAGTSSVNVNGGNGVDEGKKRELVKVLLGVYMNDEEISSTRAAHLLNAQAVNLDILDVIDLVPSQWPLEVMTSFLARSFRRLLHSKHEGLILKNLSTGQNLLVKEQTWHPIHEAGAIIEEAVSDDDDDNDNEKGGDGGEVIDEKGALVGNEVAITAATGFGREE
ncbi:hypothetical protein AX16_003085 [Volvariella volvacea WC 439]|nr:hypothetical protein AX16_003085 [Volvariella volvacea WC 439]